MGSLARSCADVETLLHSQFLAGGIAVVGEPATHTIRIEGIESYWGAWLQPETGGRLRRRLNAIQALLALSGYGILPMNGCPPYLVILRIPPAPAVPAP